MTISDWLIALALGSDKMPIELIDIIKPKNDGEFPIVEDSEILGGFKAVADLTARDAIYSGRRKEGMWVKVLSDGKVYQLDGGITNGDWSEVVFGGGGSVPDPFTPTDGTWNVIGNISVRGSGAPAGSEQFGEGASAVGGSSLAVGPDASASNFASVALGHDATSSTRAIAIGDGATANGNEEIAIGHMSNAGILGSAIAIGPDSVASNAFSVALGTQASCSGNAGIALAKLANATSNNTVALGAESSAIGAESVCVGYQSSSGGGNSVVLGSGVTGSNTGVVSIGAGSQALGVNSTSVGRDSDCILAAAGATAVGNGAVVQYINATSIGAGAQCLTSGCYASVAIGGATVSKNNSVAAGSLATITGNRGTAVGYNTTAGANTDTTAIGSGATASGLQSTAAGYNSSATATGALALGGTASGLSSATFGPNSLASNSNTVALANLAVASGKTAVALGYNTLAGTGFGAVAIGANAQATSTRSIALGYNARSTTTNTCTVGQVSLASFSERLNLQAAGNVRVHGKTANNQETQIKIAAVDIVGPTGATATATNLIPAGALVLGVTTRNIGSIGGVTGFDVGDGTDQDLFAANTSNAGNSTSDNTDRTDTAIKVYTGLTSVVLTAQGGTFSGTGTVRVSVHYVQIVAPTN